MINELNKVLDELELNENVRTLIITSNGRAFSAGADVTSFQSLKPINLIRLSSLKDLSNKTCLYAKPVIAALNGYALDGGLEMAMACDIRKILLREKDQIIRYKSNEDIFEFILFQT